MAVGIVVAALLIPNWATSAPPPTRTLRFTQADDAAVSSRFPRQRLGGRRFLRLGGPARWRSYVRFPVSGLSGTVRRATLIVYAKHPVRARVLVRLAIGRRGWRERRVRARTAPFQGAVIARHYPGRKVRRIAFNVTRAVRHDGQVSFVLASPSRRLLRFKSSEALVGRPRLLVQVEGRSRSRVITRRPVSPLRPVSGAAVQAGAKGALWVAQAEAPVNGTADNIAAPQPGGPSGSVMITPAEIASLPASGPAWNALKAYADSPAGSAKVSNQDSNHDIATLAVALVAARTGDAGYRQLAQSRIAAAIDTERPGRVLALARNLVSYIVAADVINLAGVDPALDARFRAWLARARDETLDSWTLVTRHEQQPNNWGTMSGASRAAIDAYLGDAADLRRTATVFRGWLGDRATYTGFTFDSDLSWQADRSRPVGVDLPGTTIQGLSVDGALPDDMRRGCPFRIPPCHTDYGWEALQGAVVQAQILYRQGFDAWNWSDQALFRAAAFFGRLEAEFGGWWAVDDDTWVPWMINHAYGTAFPTAPVVREGKNMSFTDWLYG
ncbi:MAG TPA: alginate lyase family protein [Vicinamibacteria bacterium]|nr:alginate lyase family protein [Vicinamibacteria bacterium]